MSLRLFSFEKLIILLKSSVFVSSKMPYYAVAKGRTPGIFMTWADCEAQVKGFPGAKYKKFDSEGGAQVYIDTNGGNLIALKGKPPYPVQSSVTTSHNNNLKRTYSTSTSYQSKSKSYGNESNKFRSSEEDSDDSDDLNTILCKHLDDIETRLDKFTKSVAKTGRKVVTDHSESKRLCTIPSNMNNNFEIDNDGYVQVYTDGSCTGNGRNGAKAGLGVYWGDGHTLNISEPVSGRATNNCGEIQAATKAIKVALENGVQKLCINTDSQFLINSVTKWMSGWKKKGWRLASGEPVKNEKDFKDLDSVQNKLQIKWKYVEAHKGLHGNEMADQLAKAGAACMKNYD